MDKSGHIVNDMWLCNTTTKLWKKVMFLAGFLSRFCVHKQAVMFNYVNSLGDNLALC